MKNVKGSWAESVSSVNSMIDDLVRPTIEVSRVLDAVAEGDLSQKMSLKIEGQPVRGEFLRIGTTVNTMLDQLSSFASEVTRVAREVGTEGILGGQARVKDVSGIWRDLTDNVNFMANNLTTQVRNIAEVTTAVANGDLSKKITVDVKGEVLELKNTINTMVDQLRSFADEVTRVAREVGTEGKLGGQATVKGVSGTWKDLTDNVNFMATNLTTQVRGIAKVVTAVADGNLNQKFTIEAKGEVAALADTINSMIDTLRVFAEQVTIVARQVGTEGELGGQAEVPGVAGTWKALTDSVNGMAANLIGQVRGHTVHAVGQCLPGPGDSRHLRLAAELALGPDLARDGRHLFREDAQRVDHRVDRVREGGDLALRLDRELLVQVAVCDCRHHLRDAAHLRGQVRRHEVDVVGQVLPGAADALDGRLPAQLSFGADLARDARHFVCERAQLVDHRVDRVLELENLALDVDGDLLASGRRSRLRSSPRRCSAPGSSGCSP